MRIVFAIVLLLVVTGCQRSSHAPQAAPVVIAPAPAASIAASPSPAANGGVPVRSKKRASANADASAKPGTGTKQSEGGDQVGYDEHDPCAGLVDDDALDECLAREEAAAPDRAGSYRDDTTTDHPEIDPRDRALMDAEQADAVDRRQNGDRPDAQDQDAGSLPEDDYPPSDDLPPPEDYPPDENADEPPAPDPYQR